MAKSDTQVQPEDTEVPEGEPLLIPNPAHPSVVDATGAKTDEESAAEAAGETPPVVDHSKDTIVVANPGPPIEQTEPEVTSEVQTVQEPAKEVSVS